MGCSPSALSATVRLEVYASFEFQPMLGTEEQLRELTVTVTQLLDYSAAGTREWNQLLRQGSRPLQRDSVYLLLTGRGHCVPVFIHFYKCQAAGAQG